MTAKAHWFPVTRKGAIYCAEATKTTVLTPSPKVEVPVSQGEWVCRYNLNSTEIFVLSRSELEQDYRSTAIIRGKWQKWVPNPTQTFQATQMKFDFRITGLGLSGKAGDFVVKDEDDERTWILTRTSFNKTYLRVVDPSVLTQFIQSAPTPEQKGEEIVPTIDEEELRRKTEELKKFEEEKRKAEELKKKS